MTEAHCKRGRWQRLALALVAVATTAAAPRAIQPTVRLPGEIVAHPDRQATVAARVEGIIESLTVEPGDAVTRGDVLATVRAPNLQSLRAAEAALRAAAPPQCEVVGTPVAPEAPRGAEGTPAWGV